MTKLFKYDINTGFEYNGESLTPEDVVSKLNELHDENEKLIKINIHLCQSIEEDMRCKQ